MNSLQLPHGSARRRTERASTVAVATTDSRYRPVDLRRFFFAGAARPLRFAIVGGGCALIQIGLLYLLLRAGAPAIPANIAAYLMSAQVNFVLSDLFIWHDRHAQRAGNGLIRRWLSFHASIAATFVLNELVFIGARIALPDLVAAAAGIGVGAVVNFIIQDSLTFR